MDITYTDASHVDVGELRGFRLDVEEGDERNDFELSLDIASPIRIQERALVYADGTEWGGVVDSLESDPKDRLVRYRGRTWTGVLANKILCPDAGKKHLSVSGDANAVLASLVSRMGLSGRFRAPDKPAGIAIDHSFPRYCDGYSGIRAMLAKAGAKLSVRCVGGVVELSAVPVADYTDGPDADRTDVAVSKAFRPFNHLISLGKGEGASRIVRHDYADERGRISRTQTLKGIDERAQTYDYSNADADELAEKGPEKLKELQDGSSWKVDLEPGWDYDIGDVVPGIDPITGTEVVASVGSKIATITDAGASVEYKAGGTAASASQGGGTGGSGEATLVAGPQGPPGPKGDPGEKGEKGDPDLGAAQDKFQVLRVTKVGDYGLAGHRFQGMACDGTYLYMMSHEGDSGPTTVTKVKTSDGTVVSRTEIALTGHFNSTMHLDGWLYASCAGNGGDYGYMACIKCSDLSYKTYRLPYDFWSIAVADAGSGLHLAGLVADTHEWAVFAKENPDSWRMTPFKRLVGYDGSGIAQGCDADSDYLYHLLAHDPSWSAKNNLAVMEWSGYVRRILPIRGCGDVELEDVCIPKGYDGPIYVNDIDGSVWRGTLSGVLKPEYKTNLRSPWIGSPIQTIYNEGNGTEALASSSPRVVSSFKANPFVYASTLVGVLGQAKVNGYPFPVSYDADGGSLSCTGSYLKGYKHVGFALVWTRTSNSRQYGWKLDSDSWVCDIGAEKTYYGASGIANSGLVPKGLSIGSLAGVFGLAPGDAISL